MSLRDFFFGRGGEVMVGADAVQMWVIFNDILMVAY